MCFEIMILLYDFNHTVKKILIAVKKNKTSEMGKHWDFLNLFQ